MPISKPRVFLCHASEDKPIASKVAHDLVDAGVDTFYDDWSIRAGDSLRNRIDEGIGGCTHFVVLLSRISLLKPWVQAEIDGGFVKKIEGTAKFIPLRYELPVSDLPPLLRGLHSPEISTDHYETAMRNLLSELWGVSQKPPLGEAPRFSKRVTTSATGFSKGAERIAKLMVEGSERGRRGDPQLTLDDLMEKSGLTIEEIEVAVDELESRGCVRPHLVAGAPPLGYNSVEADKGVFLKFDPVFMGWNPIKDAASVAAEILNSDHGYLNSAEICQVLDWSPRRLNPAVSVLIRRSAVIDDRTIHPLYVSPTLMKNNRTARFLRDHQ